MTKKKTPRERELTNRKAVAARRRKQADKPAAKKPSSLPGLTRQSKKPRKLGARIKSGHDGPKKKKAVARTLRGLGELLRDGEAQTRWPAEIDIGKRFRIDKGDIAGLAASINARRGVIQPIAIDTKNKLIDGERRLLAWQHPDCKFRERPIPVYVVDIDSLVDGEYDANAHQKPFTPSETVAIKRALEPRLAEEAKKRKGGGRKKKQGDLFAEGDAASGEIPRTDRESGRAAARVAKLVGKDRRTVEKAEAVVAAAEQDPKRFGKLKEDMDRTGKVDGPHKRLKIMQATDKIRAAPPPLPMNGPYSTIVIDFPWPYEGEADQDEIDAQGRSLRPYPAMSIKSGCHFLRDQVAPLLAPDCSVWLWTTNHHLVKGYAHHLIAALGFEGRGVTMLTWSKDKIGRGKVLRDKTEHCILLTRGNPVVNNLGKDPPSTEMCAPRREHSRKPDEFYRLIERVTPAARYASIFSTGGEGPQWDSHGDQVGKHALPPGPEENSPDVSAYIGGRADAGSPKEKEISHEDQVGEALVKITEGGVIEDAAVRGLLQKDKLIAGKHKLRLTKAGEARLQAYADDQIEKRQLAELPDAIDELIDDYKATLARRHDAIMGPEWQHIKGTAIHGKREDIVADETRRLRLLQMKANGGTNFGMACDDSPAERLRASAAAPIGEVPMWGQRGMFRIEVDGLACLATHNECLDFEAFACSDAPFISETGYQSFCCAGDGPAFCVTVDEQAAAFVREEMVATADHLSGKRKPLRKGAMPKPENWYRLPESWAEYFTPICIGGDGPGGRTSAGESNKLVGEPVEIGALIRCGEAELASDPGLLAGSPVDPGPISEGVRRCADNRAPFMDAAGGNGAGDGPCVAASHGCPASEAAPAAAERGDGSAAIPSEGEPIAVEAAE